MHTEKAAAIRGVGRPAASAARVTVGITYSLRVRAPTIVVSTPSASSPANRRVWDHRRPRGAGSAPEAGRGLRWRGGPAPRRRRGRRARGGPNPRGVGGGGARG